MHTVCVMSDSENELPAKRFVKMVACVAGAKRGWGGGREKGKREGAPALRAYVFA